jgi:hypothetical protein
MRAVATKEAELASGLEWLKDDLFDLNTKLPLLPHPPPLQRKCTAYERQGRCSSPRLQKDLPRCPSALVAAALRRARDRVGAADDVGADGAAYGAVDSGVDVAHFAFVGDAGLTGSGCAEAVGDLFVEYDTQLRSLSSSLAAGAGAAAARAPVRDSSGFEAVFSLGDNAYWSGSCDDHARAFMQLPYGRLFPLLPANKCVDPREAPRRARAHAPWGSQGARVLDAARAREFASAGVAAVGARGGAPGHVASVTGYPGELGLIVDRVATAAAAVGAGASTGGSIVFRLPAPFAPSTEVPRVAQLAQRLEYLHHLLRAADLVTGAAPSGLQQTGTPQVPAAGAAELRLRVAAFLNAQFRMGSLHRTAGADPDAGPVGLDAPQPGARAALADIAASLGWDDFEKELPAAPASARGKTSPRATYFPIPGNHDYDKCWDLLGTLAYDQYFQFAADFAPGADLSGGLFYRHAPAAMGGALEVFALNSNFGHPNEADNQADQLLHRAQLAWLRQALSTSTAQFRVVVLHHPPHASAQHDANSQWVNLPFKQWGADVVVSGHQHAYERLQLPEELAVGEADPAQQRVPPVSPPFPNPRPWPGSAVYVLNGLGGHNWVYSVDKCDAHPASLRRYNAAHGILIGSFTRRRDPQPATADRAQPSTAAAAGPQSADIAGAGASRGLRATVETPPPAEDSHEGFTAPADASLELSLCFVSLESNEATGKAGKLIDHVSLFA